MARIYWFATSAPARIHLGRWRPHAAILATSRRRVFFFLVFVFVFVLARGKLTHKINKHPLFAVFVANSTQQQRFLSGWLKHGGEL
jgi:hypothetical protein